MADHLSDAVLLERFATRREQEAFALLVKRHRPRVLAACRRILACEHDVEDAAQLAFLLLALKAGEVPWRDSVGGWLCGVARRLALSARAVAARRRRRETPLAALAQGGTEFAGGLIPEKRHPEGDPLAEITRRDLRRLLDDELGKLPPCYRAPVVLCDLEGLTHQDAARRLGWPSGSMSGRLREGRAILRKRLAGRGLPIGLLVIAALIATAARTVGTRDNPAREAVRQEMAVFREAGSGGGDLRRLLDQIRQDDTAAAGRAEAERIARESARVAGRVMSQDPGRDRADWQALAARMQASASRLELAARGDDGPALLAAARQLNESCVRCHLAFRDEPKSLPPE